MSGFLYVIPSPNVDMMRSMNMGAVNVSVVVNNNGSSTETQTNSKMNGDGMGKALGVVIQQAIQKETRQGGIIYNVLNNKMGR